MRRVIAVVGAAAALLAFTAVPAQAQIDDILDLPTLGFAIEPDEGFVGDTVDGWVDTDDVAEHCITDPTEFVGQFLDTDNPQAETPWTTAAQGLSERWYGDPNPPQQPETPEDMALAVAFAFPFGLFLDLPQQGGDGQLVEDALLQTFVMAFADLETASPLSPFGNFSPDTGEGSTPVPEVAPGIHPVIATCVGIDQEALSVDSLELAIEEVVPWIEENIAQPYPAVNPDDPEFLDVAGAIAPELILSLIEPMALGIEFYCVLDADGVCVAPLEDLIDEEGTGLEDLTDADGRDAADAVTATPSFTG